MLQIKFRSLERAVVRSSFQTLVSTFVFLAIGKDGKYGKRKYDYVVVAEVFITKVSLIWMSD